LIVKLDVKLAGPTSRLPSGLLKPGGGMGAFLLNTVLPLIGTLLVGALGWWATYWIANPIVAFEKLRAEIREEVFVVTNIGSASPADVVNAASDRLRRLAARVDSTTSTTSRLVRLYLRMRDYDTDAAVKQLIGLSNQLTDKTGARILLRRRIERALKLPFTDAEDLVRSVQDSKQRDTKA